MIGASTNTTFAPARKNINRALSFDSIFKRDDTKEVKGSYGLVYAATSREGVPTRKAIKQTEMMDAEGIDFTTLREIVIMEELKHINIMRLNGVHRFIEKRNVLYMEMDMALSDFSSFLRSPLPHSDIRYYSFQLLQGLDYCHSHQLLHRDLKPGNILVFDGPIPGAFLLKIADWGLGRTIAQPSKAYTPEVQTLVYRAPEVVAKRYSYFSEMDVWSIGLIIGEMLKGCPVLLHSITSEIALIKEWERKIGLPPKKLYGNDFPYNFPEQGTVADMSHLVASRAILGEDVNHPFNKECIAFIKKMLRFDQTERISAHEGLLEQYQTPAFADERIQALYDRAENWDLEFHTRRRALVKDMMGKRYLPTPSEEGSSTGYCNGNGGYARPPFQFFAFENFTPESSPVASSGFGDDMKM